MHWIFLDAIGWDYDVQTPLVRPLGGSQSALCYLATALARRGNQVTTVTGIGRPRTVNGVHCLSLADVPGELFARPQSLIVALNEPGHLVAEIRRIYAPRAPVILWTQHAHDQPAALPLLHRDVQSLWDRIVCISDWQRQMYCRRLGVRPEKIAVLRNAISPPFQQLTPTAEQLAAARAPLLRLAYTSTPFRGLDVLADCFPEIHRRHPHCRLDVFSSMQVYQQEAIADEYASLYAHCQCLPGVYYRGSIGQEQLARELLGTSVLAYPNTFAETSCIAVMEALAAGLLVVSSDLGALPETCQGFARLIPPIAPSRSRQAYARDFTEAVDGVLSEIQSDPVNFAARQAQQAAAIAGACNWDVRAAEWEQAARGWLVGHG